MRKHFLITIVLLAASLTFSNAKADLYIHPEAGAAVPLNGGDPSYSLGGTVGYQWTSFFATEVSYLRLIGTGSSGDGDIVSGEGVLSFPGEMVTPYVSGGLGALHADVPGGGWNSMILVGGGLSLTPISLFTLNVGVNYAAVQGGSDFLQPAVGIGLHF